MQYSTEFITDKILETAVNDTSIYRWQKNGKFMNTNMAEALSLPGIKVVVMLVKVKPQKVKLEVIFNFSLLWEQFLRLTHNLFMLVKLIYWALLSFFFFFHLMSLPVQGLEAYMTWGLLYYCLEMVQYLDIEI